MQIRVEVLQFRIPAPKFIAPKNAELRRIDLQALTDQTQRHPHVTIKLSNLLCSRHAPEIRCRESKGREYRARPESVAAH